MIGIHPLPDDYATIRDGDIVEVGHTQFRVIQRAPAYDLRESHERLSRLAEKAFTLGLTQGRSMAWPISREALIHHLDLVVVRYGLAIAANEVTVEESRALRSAYGGAHTASFRASRGRR